MPDIAPTRAVGERAATGLPVVLVQLTDFHIRSEGKTALLGVDTEQTFAEVVEAVSRWPKVPDMALLTGDLVQDPEISAYRRLKNGLRKLPCPGYCLPGNHDDPKLLADILLDTQFKAETIIDLGPWQIICLDSAVPDHAYGYLADGQLGLLAQCLELRPERFSLVAVHHHPVDCGSRWMDTMTIRNSERFFEILATYGQTRAVVYGHIHQATDSMYRGIRLLGTPSTCFQFKPNQIEFSVDAMPPGCRWIELYPDGTITTEIMWLQTLPSGLELRSEGYLPE